MSFSSATILTHMAQQSGGYARQHHFEFTCAPPAKLQIQSVNLRRVMMNCFSAVLPGRQIATKESDQGGVIKREMPHTPIFTEMPLNFYLSDDLAEKRFFDAWQDLIYEPKFGNLSYYEDYVVSASLIKKSRRSKVSGERDTVMEYELLECWPKIVGDVQVTYQGKDEICYLPVSMVYYQFKNDQSMARDLIKSTR